ncbi:MAG: hypothetical protein ACPLPR_08560 [Bacillota bacterium]
MVVKLRKRPVAHLRVTDGEVSVVLVQRGDRVALAWGYDAVDLPRLPGEDRVQPGRGVMWFDNLRTALRGVSKVAAFSAREGK